MDARGSSRGRDHGARMPHRGRLVPAGAPSSTGLFAWSLLAALFAAAPPAGARAPELLDGGLRLGGGDGYDAVELYARWRAERVQRLALRLAAGCRARWELSLARWQGPVGESYLVGVGPVIDCPMAAGGPRLSVGVRPAVLSEHAGTGDDLGGPGQFTSHVGVEWRIDGGWTLGLRGQHTSNADLYSRNPGVDMGVVELRRVF